MPELGLESHHVVERAERVVLAELHDGETAAAGPWIGEADRLHRSPAQRIRAARRHYLDRETALEIRRAFPLMRRHRVGALECRHEPLVGVARQGAIDVVGAVALAVAGLAPRD